MFFDWIGRKEYFNKFLVLAWKVDKAVNMEVSLHRLDLMDRTFGIPLARKRCLMTKMCTANA
jgi:hypothetical protein